MRNRIWVGAILLVVMSPVAGAQQGSQESPSAANQKSSEAQAQHPKPAPKVWTEENIGAVRKPADDYLEQAKAQKEADAAQARLSGNSQATSAPDKPAKDDFIAPNTAEEAQTRLLDEQDQMKNVLSLMERTKEQIAGEKNETVRAALEQKLRLLGEDQKYVGEEIQKLQAALANWKGGEKESSPKKPGL